MLNSFFDRLNANTVVITSTQRLSLVLNQQYLNYQQSNLSCWPAVTITSLPNWLEQVWQQLCEHLYICPQPVLTDYQQQILWEEIIHSSTATTGLLRTSQTAHLAIQAWQQLHRWDVSLSPEFDLTEDTAAFKQWALTYDKRCQDNGWLNQLTLVENIITLLAKVKPRYQPKILLLVGFMEFTPQQQRLLAALKGADYTIEFFNPSLQATPPKVYACQDNEQELTTAAQWIKTLLTEEDITCLIGCIVPNLAEQQDKLEATFTHILCPDYFLTLQATQRPFNIAANIRLNQYPIIHSALHGLKLLLPLIPLEILSTIIRSPFFTGAETEQTARALLDRELATLGERIFELNDVLAIMGRFEDQRKVSITGLGQSFQSLRNHCQSIALHRTPDEWADFFKETLTLLGWPGDKPLTSHEHQAKERWEEALKEFAGLGVVVSTMSLTSAYERLQQLVQHILFQPKDNASSVYILNPTDALGFPFTHLWITGMNDNMWPPAPKPNPFIPFQLQSRLAMPHATAEHELRYQQRLLKQLTTAAQETLLSYSLYDEEEVLRPSALLSKNNRVCDTDLAIPPPTTLTNRLFNTGHLEYLLDEQGPAITQKETIKGGINIFKGQAACPFKAFAEHRLGANSIRLPQIGLSASERGNLVHAAMEYLWKKVINHQTLCSYTEQQLQAVVQRAANKAVLALKSRRPQLLKPRFKAIEIKRLTNIILQWLRLEKQRTAFEVVATEQKQQYIFADIPLQVRIDRIDQLADGSHLIIDYKTGHCSENAWFGDRPDDPQLPLYCINSMLPVSGLLFAQISSRDNRFKGIVNLESHAIAPFDLKPIANWIEQNEQWKHALQHLADQFRHGYAKVHPKEPKKTCQFCDLTLLCRVNDVG